MPTRTHSSIWLSAGAVLAFGASVAQAQLLVPKGATGTLKVEYLYTAAGKTGTENGGNIDEWKVRRQVAITANYVADAPQPVGALHKPDATQQAAMDKQRTQTEAFAKSMQPTMQDMMKIVERCGESDEECISKAVAAYGNGMDVNDVKAKKQVAEELTKPGAPRYQLWKMKSQSGTYLVDELTTHQVFEMTCTRTQVCKRTVMTRGGGDIPQLAGRSIEGASMIEVDSVSKDLVVMLPAALLPLKVESVVQTTIQDDDVRGGPAVAMPLTMNQDPMTFTIPGNVLTASGGKTVKGKGTGAESGTLTVNWTFTRN
jgi:hypothetical protein